MFWPFKYKNMLEKCTDLKLQNILESMKPKMKRCSGSEINWKVHGDIRIIFQNVLAILVFKRLSSIEMMG